MEEQLPTLLDAHPDLKIEEMRKVAEVEMVHPEMEVEIAEVEMVSMLRCSFAEFGAAEKRPYEKEAEADLRRYQTVRGIEYVVGYWAGSG